MFYDPETLKYINMNVNYLFILIKRNDVNRFFKANINVCSIEGEMPKGIDFMKNENRNV